LALALALGVWPTVRRGVRAESGALGAATPTPSFPFSEEIIFSLSFSFSRREKRASSDGLASSASVVARNAPA
jgi:hypothetical protein